VLVCFTKWGKSSTGENKRPVANHWQTQSHNVVSSTPRHLLDSNSQLQRWYALIALDFWYGYYTVLLLTLRYVHELSIRRLLFVYTCNTEGQCKNVGAVVVVIVWQLYFHLPMQSVPITTNSIQHYANKFVSDLRQVACYGNVSRKCMHLL
jgi:hypothetical protein